jgi:hypothetical protein
MDGGVLGQDPPLAWVGLQEQAQATARAAGCLLLSVVRESVRMLLCNYASGSVAQHRVGAQRTPHSSPQPPRLTTCCTPTLQQEHALESQILQKCCAAGCDSCSRICSDHTRAEPPPAVTSGYKCAGATGLIGSRLVSKLTSAGHVVYVLTRDPASAPRKLPYPNVRAFAPRDWQSAIASSDAVINLAGEPIATRKARTSLLVLSTCL